MHQFARANHAPAKRGPNRLMPQAHAENWNFAREALDQRDADSGLLRRAGTGRNHDVLRPHFLDLVECDAIVATHFELLPHLAQILREVISKGIVVVEYQ